MKIVVLTNGFVMVCKQFDLIDGHIHMMHVRTIRRWGTSNGLGELVSGPTKETQLDAMVPVVSAPLHSLVFSFDVSEAWCKHLG